MCLYSRLQRCSLVEAARCLQATTHRSRARKREKLRERQRSRQLLAGLLSHNASPCQSHEGMPQPAPAGGPPSWGGDGVKKMALHRRWLTSSPLVPLRSDISALPRTKETASLTSRHALRQEWQTSWPWTGDELTPSDASWLKASAETLSHVPVTAQSQQRRRWCWRWRWRRRGRWGF